MRFLDLCTGIGGFSLGLEWAGMECAGQVEIDPFCTKVLEKHWPHVPRWKDLKNEREYDEYPTVDLMSFGDPCPKHSRARSNGKSVHPDLSGYCLALVGRCRPRWVVRENVPAPTVDHFAICLEYLGYGTIVVRMDSATHTGQSRQRDYIVGCHQAGQESLRAVFYDYADGRGRYTTRLGTRPIVPALTTHRTRYDSRDCYVWHPEEQVIRILDGEEREAFAGFPRGWVDGLSEATFARMYGNSVTPQLVMQIGLAIRVATGCA